MSSSFSTTLARSLNHIIVPTVKSNSNNCRSKDPEVVDVESHNGPPKLRKTAINTAFKFKYSSEKENSGEARKSDDDKSTEQKDDKSGAKKKVHETSTKGSKRKRGAESAEKPVKVESPKAATKKDEKSSSEKKDSPIAEKKTTGKRKISSADEEDSQSPVRKSIRKRAAVIESSDEEEAMEAEEKYDPKPVVESPKKVKSPSPKKQSPKKEKSLSPEKEKKPVPNFFSPKPSSVKQSNKTEPEVKSEPSTPVAEKKPVKNAFAGFFSPKPGSAKRNEGGMDYDSKVKLTSYHPVDNAFWSREEPTPYLALARTLEAIEATSGRLRTIEILSNYFRSVMVQTPGDLLPSVYMSLGRLAPAWEGVELGIGDSILMKSIGVSCGRSVAQIKSDMEKTGDLGIVAEQSRGGQRTMFQPAILTVQSVFKKLREIAKISGGKSGDKKVDLIQSMLVACRGSEARYIIRSLSGKIRIGMAEQSILQALAQATVQTPLGQEYPPEVHTSYRSTDNDKFKEVLGKESLMLKTAYCECPSYDLIIPALLSGGVENLSKSCKLTPGIPLKPMLAHPTKGVQEVLTRFENCAFTCEWKYDGERAQIHLHEDGSVNIFSRNQEDNTSKYPDIISRLPNCLGKEVKTAVLDCEAVAWDRETKQIQPFQVLSTRKRKDAVEEEIKVQVCLFAFDLLYLNGEALVRRSFKERRDLLHQNFSLVENEFQYAKSVDGNTTEEIQEALEESIKGETFYFLLCFCYSIIGIILPRIGAWLHILVLWYDH